MCIMVYFWLLIFFLKLCFCKTKIQNTRQNSKKNKKINKNITTNYFSESNEGQVFLQDTHHCPFK